MITFFILLTADQMRQIIAKIIKSGAGGKLPGIGNDIIRKFNMHGNTLYIGIHLLFYYFNQQ